MRTAVSLKALPAIIVLAVLAYLPYVPIEVPGLLPPGQWAGQPPAARDLPRHRRHRPQLRRHLRQDRTAQLRARPLRRRWSYLLTISLSDWALPLPVAVLVSLGVTTLLALVVGGIALRVGGIAFAMVTLAFAQAASIIVMRNAGGLTGGEEGKSLNRSAVPELLVGVANAPYRYWLALGFVVVAFVVVTLLVRSRAGHAMAAVRENEARAAVLGFDTYRVKLLAIVVGAVLGGLGGIVHALVLGGSNPHVTTTEFTLALLIMVVLGGAGSMCARSAASSTTMPTPGSSS